MSCLLRAGIGSEEETVHDSTLTPRAVNSRDLLHEFKVLDAKIDHYSQVKNFRYTKRKHEAQ